MFGSERTDRPPRLRVCICFLVPVWIFHLQMIRFFLGRLTAYIDHRHVRHIHFQGHIKRTAALHDMCHRIHMSSCQQLQLHRSLPATRSTPSIHDS